MKIETINGKEYRLPGSLTTFQENMYLHLINYKWNKLHIHQPGTYNYKGAILEYDAILPESCHKDYPLIYNEIRSELFQHQKQHYFKLHKHFNHMASSQAANVNLFLPLLLSPNADKILQQLKPDFASLDREQLYKGFQIEYWDGKGKEKGLLGDHNARSGTDADIAIAYRNKAGEPCLWLIEHKLTEKEFTTCGGAKSNNRNKNEHRCESSFSEILVNKHLCYYHDVRKTNYWKITDRNQAFFPNFDQFNGCPFKGGTNQLWRNQMLALALENEGRYKHVYFSVVHHPQNKALNKTISQYKTLTDNNPKFSVFTSGQLVNIVKQLHEPELQRWVDWYCELYGIGE